MTLQVLAAQNFGAISAEANRMQLLWHRNDLRTHDNPALSAVLERAKHNNQPVVPLVIIDPKIFKRSDVQFRWRRDRPSSNRRFVRRHRRG